METKYLQYAVCARRFNWTPDQVDAIPIDVDTWLLPIISVMDEVEQDKMEEQRR